LGAENVQKPEDRALSFAHAFLGVRIECAQCHKHPFDQWTKDDYVQFSSSSRRFATTAISAVTTTFNFVTATKEVRAAGVGKDSADARRAERRDPPAIDAGEIFPIHEVYIATRRPRSTTARQNAQAYSGRVLTPKLLGGQNVLLSEYADPREPLVNWLRSKENPFSPAPS
jgi:hypothetical protein